MVVLKVCGEGLSSTSCFRGAVLDHLQQVQRKLVSYFSSVNSIIARNALHFEDQTAEFTET